MKIKTKKLCDEEKKKNTTNETEKKFGDLTCFFDAKYKQKITCR